MEGSKREVWKSGIGRFNLFWDIVRYEMGKQFFGAEVLDRLTEMGIKTNILTVNNSIGRMKTQVREVVRVSVRRKGREAMDILWEKVGKE